ncbi:MAG: ArsC family transcriptional regulator [Clostridia bacterium]|nr:ArsC family transcriptional regulator [Clostridia bacterium]
MAAIQIYVSKKNFDQQKAERFFKERRVTVQVLNLKKHRLGERELQTLARAGGLTALIDREDKRVKEHPACYYDRDSLLIPAVLEAPWLLRSPIVRCGNRVTVGYEPETWTAWLAEG